MKVLLLNGSPRKGNTYAALEAVKKDLENVSDIQVKEIPQIGSYLVQT